MMNVDYWSYRSLMDIFNSKRLPKEKCFEYILLSVSNFTEVFNTTPCYLNNYHEEPYELYDYMVMSNLKSAHKELPKYIDMELDVERYHAINEHVGKINIKKAEINDCGSNPFKWLKLRFDLYKMLRKELSVKDFINYFFLRMLDEEEFDSNEHKKLFLKNLKKELTEFAQSFPQNSNFLGI